MNHNNKIRSFFICISIILLFQKPNPFEADVVVSIDEVFEQKLKAIWKFESQIESLWATRAFEKIIPVPKAGPAREERFQKVRAYLFGRDGSIADKYRDRLIEIYGEKKGRQVKTAEAFELCEYGRQVSQEELLKLFLVK